MKYLILKTANAEGGGDPCTRGLLYGRGELSYLNWWDPETVWVLYETDEYFDNYGGVGAREGVIVYRGSREGALQILADRVGLSVREWVCQDPPWAYYYARYVDQRPRDDTREGACRNPEWAYQYACDVDQGPRDETREAVCKDPGWAYYYAIHVDRKPRDDTRWASGKDSRWARKYYQAFEKDFSWWVS